MTELLLENISVSHLRGEKKQTKKLHPPWVFGKQKKKKKIRNGVYTNRRMTHLRKNNKEISRNYSWLLFQIISSAAADEVIIRLR